MSHDQRQYRKMKILKEAGYHDLQERFEQRKAKGRKRFYIALAISLTLLALGIALGNGILIGLGILATGLSGRFLYAGHILEVGIKGEKIVADALQELDDSYYLINNIRVPGKAGQIDHVLLCPKGIFCIETKNWMGDIRCNRDQWSMKGKRRIYKVKSVSKQAWEDASGLNEIICRKANIGVPVTPICVFTNPSAKLKLTRPTLTILRVAEVAQYVRNVQPSTHLTEEEILSIAEGVLPKHVTQTIIHK